MTNIESNLPEFDDHKLIVPIADESVGLRGFIAIHRGGTAEHPAFGATRLWNYHSEEDALRDALRLSRLMSYKSAVAGFSYGGAKGVLICPDGGIKNRRRFFEAYAGKINELKGGFITGTDVGVTDEDVHVMKAVTPYVIGSKLDPAYYTALGVVEGIGVCLKRVFGSPAFKRRSFALQGLGKVGTAVLGMIYDDAGTIFVSDLDPGKISLIKRKFPRVVALRPDEIYGADAEVFVPCALGGTLNDRSVAQLKCRIVAGSANNQLADKESAAALYRRGILYAPDYIINTGGFIGVMDEYQYGTPDSRRILKNIGHMRHVLGDVFDMSEREKKSPGMAADDMVEQLVDHRSVVRIPLDVI